MKKLRLVLLFSPALLFLLVLPVSAAGETLPDAYGEVEDVLPEEIGEYLPDGLFSSDTDTVADAAERMTDPAYLCDVFLSLAGVCLRQTLSLFVTLFGILLLSAVAGTVRENFSGGTGDTFAFCTRIAVFAAIASTVTGTVETVRTYFTNLSGFCASLVPVMGTLYAIGGNVRAAVSSSAILEVYLSFSGSLAGTTVVPLFAVCLALLIIGAFGSVDTAPFSGFLRKTYMTVLSFFTLLLSVLLGARTVLAAKADSVGLRGMRFAVGNIVPVVGGSVAEMSSTVAAGVEYLRGTVGVVFLMLLGFLLVPTVLRLFLTRAVFNLSAAVAGLIGCREEGKLLTGIGELYGYLIGIACLSSSVAVVALAVLTNCSAAVGG